jgi:asparagine synthase (glutamine-hydrolysing)
MHGNYDLEKKLFNCWDMSNEISSNEISNNVIIRYSGFIKHDVLNSLDIMNIISDNYDNMHTFKNFKGNFVIAICDIIKNRLLLVRDHFGVYPLYYHIHKNVIYFGSTINSIINNREIDVNINYDRVNEYFMFGCISGKNTLFKNIIEIEPGSIAEFNGSGNVNVKYYFTLNYTEIPSEARFNYSKTFENAFNDSLIFNTFDKATKAYGALSSGGIDSSIVVSKASNILRPNIPCYYVGFDNYEYNRFNEVKKLNKFYGCEHHEYFITHEEFANNIIGTIKIIEDPILHPGSIGTNILYKYIKKEVDILLTGLGADSFYCGYYIYYLIYYLYVKNPFNYLNKIFASIIPTQYVPKKYTSHFNKIRNALYFTPDEYTIHHDILALNTKEELSKMINHDISKDTYDNYENIFLNYDKSNILNKIMLLYQTYFIVEDLNTTFKLGYHYNIEHRHPFINYHMINMFNEFPWKEKIYHFKRKPLVYEIAKNNLPMYILNKPKEGFGVPLKKWFHENKGLRNLIEILNDKKTRERGFYNKTYLDNIISSYTKIKLRDDDYEGILWPLINFELWCRIFIDKSL